MDKRPEGEAPGLLYVNSKIAKPDFLLPEEFVTWYDKEHFMDVLKSGVFREAFRWQALDPSSDRPVLCTYPTVDVALFHSDAMKEIPVESPNLPGSGKIHDLASFDTRFYTLSQLYEPADSKTGQSDFLLSVAFTPADDDEYDRWYREEHLAVVASSVPGWRRTERYELQTALLNVAPAPKNPPKFLTLHYLDGDSIPEKELAATGETEWSKRLLSTMKETDIGMFMKASHVVT